MSCHLFNYFFCLFAFAVCRCCSSISLASAQEIQECFREYITYENAYLTDIDKDYWLCSISSMIFLRFVFSSHVPYSILTLCMCQTWKTPEPDNSSIALAVVTWMTLCGSWDLPKATPAVHSVGHITYTVACCHEYTSAHCVSQFDRWLSIHGTRVSCLSSLGQNCLWQTIKLVERFI